MTATAAVLAHTAHGSSSGISAPTAALISATVAAVVAVLGLWLNGVRAERARRRVLYGEALAAVMDYKEFAYAAQRIAGVAEPDGHLRLSDAMRAVQSSLAQYEALLHVERSNTVFERYTELVEVTREIAGSYVRDAWTQTPKVTDVQMNQPGVDLSGISPSETAYLGAVKDALRWWRI